VLDWVFHSILCREFPNNQRRQYLHVVETIHGFRRFMKLVFPDDEELQVLFPSRLNAATTTTVEVAAPPVAEPENTSTLGTNSTINQTTPGQPDLAIRTT
jgi:hypothetical protein